MTSNLSWHADLVTMTSPIADAEWRCEWSSVVDMCLLVDVHIRGC
jgi:hypothetical protein